MSVLVDEDQYYGDHDGLSGEAGRNALVAGKRAEDSGENQSALKHANRHANHHHIRPNDTHGLLPLSVQNLAEALELGLRRALRLQ